MIFVAQYYRRGDENMKHKIAVIGAVNIDICGKPDGELLMEDSNPGTVSYSIGGVGFNLARNLSLLGCEVSFIAVLAEDSYLSDIRKEADRYSINIDKSLFLKDEKNSCYLFITDKNGDMAVAINDMGINRFLTKEFLESNLDFLGENDAVLFDTNLTEEIIDYICDNVKVPLFSDCVSAAKVHKIRNNIGSLYGFKPNRIEAEALTGVEITDEESAEKAAEALLSTGLNRLFVTLGDKGVLSADKNEKFFMKPLCSDEEIINTSGAGDAFFASAVKACLDKKSLKESTVCGLRGARAVCLTKKSINEEILKYTQNKE